MQWIHAGAVREACSDLGLPELPVIYVPVPHSVGEEDGEGRKGLVAQFQAIDLLQMRSEAWVHGL